LERALVADNRLIKLWVTISDRPGSLAEFCKLIAKHSGSIKEMFHERAWLKKDVFSVQVQAFIETIDGDNANVLIASLRERYENVIVGPNNTESY
jgi:threonine dehydratase